MSRSSGPPKALAKRARKAKSDLIRQAKALSGASDWAVAAQRMALFHGRWKLVGSAGREEDEKLWKAFKRASDTFYRHRPKDEEG